MISFPNAKINLGLHVLSKREDGYHDIETCLYPIKLCDILEIIESDSFSFQSSGLKIVGDSNKNLVVKAYDLLKLELDIPAVSIHLHKVIPMGAGLGGGSSDGAFVLKMLDELFDLQLINDQLLNYAGQLGSDCPFFINNIPALASGTGTDLRPIDLDLNEYRIEVRHSSVHVPTPEAYRMIRPQIPQSKIESVLHLPVSSWQESLTNDFEEPMCEQHPEILRIKNGLIKEGAIYAEMTGSGGSVFGIFGINSLR